MYTFIDTCMYLFCVALSLFLIYSHVGKLPHINLPIIKNYTIYKFKHNFKYSAYLSLFICI